MFFFLCFCLLIPISLYRFRDSIPDGTEVQDLFGFETHPDFHPETDYDPFDATLEEVLHLVTHVGYARAYSTVFGEEVGTSIANAMDIARGGQFTSIPSEYSLPVTLPDGNYEGFDITLD